jgi:hypothetical protein
MRTVFRLVALVLAGFIALAGSAPVAIGADTAVEDPAAGLAVLQRVEKAMRLELAEWKAAQGVPDLHLVMLGGRVARVEWRRIETLLGIADQAEKDPSIVATMRVAMPDEAALLDALGVDLAKPRAMPSADEVHKRLANLAQQHAPQVTAAIAAREELVAALGKELAALAAASGQPPSALDPALAANAERLFVACKTLGTPEKACRCQSDAAVGVVDAEVLGVMAGLFEMLVEGRDGMQQLLRDANMTEQELEGHFATIGAASKHCVS